MDRGKDILQDIFAYYAFDEGTGSTVADVSGHWRPATWSGTLGNQWQTPGFLGNACGNFDGSTNWVSATATTITTGASGSYSCSAWARLTNSPVLANQALHSMGFNPGYTCSPFFTTQPQNVILYSGTQFGGGLGLNISAPGVWYHYAYVHDLWCGRAQIFINGQVVVTCQFDNINKAWPLNRLHTIGARVDGTLRFMGQIDEVGVWARPLSPREVNMLYNGGRGRAWPLR